MMMIMMMMTMTTMMMMNDMTYSPNVIDLHFWI